MDLLQIFKEQWPLLAVVAWFGYRWWSASRVVRMLPALKAQGATLVDVRSAAEFAAGQAPGTVNIPLSDLAARLGEIPRHAPVVLCCASGTRSGMASLLLRKNGYSRVYNVGAWTKLA